jgi:hypothetical protein
MQLLGSHAGVPSRPVGEKRLDPHHRPCCRCAIPARQSVEKKDILVARVWNCPEKVDTSHAAMPAWLGFELIASNSAGLV